MKKSHLLGLPYTQSPAITSTLLWIAIIPRVIHTRLPFLLARPASKAPANLVLDADTKPIALGSAAGIEGVFHAQEALFALLVVSAAAAADGVGRLRGSGVRVGEGYEAWGWVD
jgi:hypothetical protein